jgi:tetratricopeptide (TPR) repeat protein
LTIALARVAFDHGDYAQARDLLRRAEGFATGQASVPSRVLLGRALTRLGQFDTARAELSRLSSETAQTRDRGSQPVVEEALGELEYERGRMSDAHAYFRRSSQAWTSEELVDESSVLARAYAGLLDGLRGNIAQGRAAILGSLEWARRTHRVALQGQCALLLSRLALSRGDDDGLRRLGELPDAQWTRLNPELQAQWQYWRSQALERRGDHDAAVAARQTARGLLARWQDAFASAGDKSGVQLRPDLRLILREEAAVRP